MSKAKEATASTVVLNYLNVQNRPYSAQDITANLQREHAFGKTAVIKALEQLAEDGSIKEKLYGKQKVYFANQEQFSAVSEEQLKILDEKVIQLSQDLQKNQQACRDLDTDFRSLSSAMTTKEAESVAVDLKEECRILQERLDKIHESSSNITTVEKEEVYAHQKKYVMAWRKRKRMATDLIGAILEGYPKTKKQFFRLE
uniref:homologous-pairing protein 2 homolog isoform X2 n=1 Tax=Myxine glutinosa TaxID=7769 RepID=UPI00358E29D5